MNHSEKLDFIKRADSLHKQSFSLAPRMYDKAVGSAQNLANTALNTGIGQKALSLGANAYNNYAPEGVKSMVGNVVSRGTTPEQLMSNRFTGGGNINVNSETVTNNDNVVKDTINTSQQGTAGTGLSQLRYGLSAGRMPTQTFRQGTPVTNNVQTEGENVVQDNLQPVQPTPRQDSQYRQKGLTPPANSTQPPQRPDLTMPS